VANERLQTIRWANGGEAVAHDSSGRVVFVAGAIPGELLDVSIKSERKRFARGTVTAVLESAAERITPTCGHVAAGCGGCDLAHVSEAGQRDYAKAVVADALQRTAGLDAPVIELDEAIAQLGYRTTLRCLVDGDRAAYRRAASNEALVVDSCEVAHPLLQELIVAGRFGEATEVTLRLGVATGERMVICEPTAEAVEVPADVLVVGTDELASGRRAWIHEEIAGRTWRVSADSFFQSRPDGAARLVDLVRDAVSDAPPGALADLYSGVGLLAGSASGGRPTQAVESSRSAVADARHNLADVDATIVNCPIEKWKPSTAAVVIADPPRSGLRHGGVDKVVATDAARVVLISCDVGSMGRDVGLLAERGYGHVSSTVIGMFPQTSHVEVVTVMDL
jgi:23S rRNA (uracil1939-C5)-methyltransferase